MILLCACVNRNVCSCVLFPTPGGVGGGCCVVLVYFTTWQTGHMSSMYVRMYICVCTSLSLSHTYSTPPNACVCVCLCVYLVLLPSGVCKYPMS